MTTISLLLTLLVDAAAAVCCAALCMLVLWQDVRRRSNRFLAIALVLFTLYAALAVLFHFNDTLHYDPALLLYISTTLYGWSLVALFIFEAYFARVDARGRRLIEGLGLVLGLLVTVLMWRGYTFTNIVQQADQTISYDLQPFGFVALLFLVIYPLFSITVLYRTKSERSRALWPITLLLPIEAVVSALPPLQALPLDALAITIVGVAAARLLMREHVFKPMVELNRKLTATNEELARVDALKSQFLANMSHELRTPLNSVIGYTELVVSGLYGPLTDKQLNRLEKVGRNGRLLLALINDVLDLSKIEAGHMMLIREPLMLSDYVKTVLEGVRPAADANHVSITYTLPPDLPRLFADPVRLEQILRNLLQNAIHSLQMDAPVSETPLPVTFAVTPEVTLTAVHEHGDIVIHIADNGRGIPLNQQSHVFDVHFNDSDAQRIDNPSEIANLGLAVTRRLVQMHGGRIWFESQGIPGKGTVFHVALPTATNEVVPIKPHTGLLGPMVLCIDDNHEAVEVLQGILEAEGFRIYGVHNGKEGIQRTRELLPDVILLDIMMPGMDGWQVMDALRADTRTAHIPVIVISSLDQSVLAEALGATASVVKPFKRADLIGVLRMALPHVPVDKQPDIQSSQTESVA